MTQEDMAKMFSTVEDKNQLHSLSRAANEAGAIISYIATRLQELEESDLADFAWEVYLFLIHIEHAARNASQKT